MSLPLDPYEEPIDQIEFHFAPTRREFVQVLGAGIVIAVAATTAAAQQQPRQGGGRGGGGRGQAPPTPLTARLHIGQDGIVTVMTGKVECGQGARAELTQAAAEELRLPPERIVLIMADTSLVPNDGTTAGSRSTPSTVPAIRQAAAAARNLLVDVAAAKWTVDRKAVELKDGKVVHGQQSLSYAELAGANEAVEAFKKTAPPNVQVTPVDQWKVMGTSVLRANARDIVTGAHKYPSDIVRPGMLYGKILRAPSYGAKMTGVDVEAAKAMKGVVVVNDNGFVGVAAPTTHAAEKALESIAKSAKWETVPGVSSAALYDHLRTNVRGGMPDDPNGRDFAAAQKKLSAKFDVAYVQHAPMEPRSAVAEWAGDRLTVWTATQNPFSVRGELARAFRLTEDKVRVIIPDFGGGFGGKHSGECAVECARLAQAAQKPVRLQWTREEEFTWAYFRPAAAIDAAASLDAKGNLATWYFVNINSGGSAVATPYSVVKGQSLTVQSTPPLRHGSYRALASTANNFARECFMDELAELAGRDSLEFRLAQLPNDRLRAVLERAAKEFDWTNKVKTVKGIGLACGTEKASYVAACVEIEIKDNRIIVKHICQAYECGKIINPKNLLAQNEGCIIQGLGPALFEEMKFADGQIKNGAFSDYRVPRIKDVPPRIDIHLIDRPDLPSVGAGETPIIAVAPAIANAVYRLTGKRVRTMPIRLA
jgi:isoquinoline 1-oxidoreductase